MKKFSDFKNVANFNRENSTDSYNIKKVKIGLELAAVKHYLGKGRRNSYL